MKSRLGLTGMSGEIQSPKLSVYVVFEVANSGKLLLYLML